MGPSFPPLELWAGIECTRTRIGDRQPDQLTRTGHRERVDDLDRIAVLGVRTLRYPVLWEHVVPEIGSAPDWRWHDERMERMREVGIDPIVGLLHHGMGPKGTDFDDPLFAERFAAYARAAAERYPWVARWLPINEPLTTARFCGLYGIWHPHARDNAIFARILEVQLRASVMAMRAIREIVPAAQFVQNEDLGTIQAVPRLRDQAAHENERRWVSFDLLTGQLHPRMRMWKLLRESGITEARLRWFAEQQHRPDLLLVDHYLTTDRLLDDRMHRYPARTHGGNGSQCYADIEAVRATAQQAPGIVPLLRGAWARYGLPIVIGEAHLGGTRDEQLRWLQEQWRAAELVRSEGVDVRAVTAWAAFGSYDWNSLLTEDKGDYEPGAFDLRAGRPRPTALATMMRHLAEGKPFDHPALDGDGWWRRDERLIVSPVATSTVPLSEPRLPSAARAVARRLVLAGTASMTLDALERVCAVRNLPVVTMPKEHLAIDDADALTTMRAWALIDANGCTASNRARQHRTARTEALARACRDADIPMVVVACHHTAAEADGHCQEQERLREETARNLHDRVLVLRPGALFGPWEPTDRLVRFLASGRRTASEGLVNPAYLPDVVNLALDLLIDGETGTWDLHHGMSCTWTDLEEAIAMAAAGDDLVLPVRSPASSVGARTMPLASLFDALTRFLAESEGLWRRPDQPEPEVVELDAGPGMRFPASEPTDTMATADDMLGSADGAA